MPLLVTVQNGALPHVLEKVTTQPVAKVVPTVTLPMESVPTIVGAVPQADTVGLVDEA